MMAGYNIPSFINQAGFILVQFLLLVLFILSYQFVFTRAYWLPGMILGFIIGSVYGFFGKEADFEKFTLIEDTLMIPAMIIAVILIYFFDWWSNIHIWSNTILVTITLFIAMTQVSSSNPLISPMGVLSKILAVPFLILVFIGTLLPNIVHPLTFKLGVVLAVIATVIIRWRTIGLTGITIAERLGRYEEISNKRESLKNKLDNIRYTAEAIGDDEIRERIEDAFEVVDMCHSKAEERLDDREFEEADNYLIQAETEVEKLVNTFEHQLQFSLQEELESRLDQAESQLESLNSEMRETGLEPTSSQQIYDRIDSLRVKIEESNLTEVEFSTENVPEIFRQINRIFSEIRDIRTAFRFRDNVSSEVEKIREEIEENYEIILLADALELSTDTPKRIKEELNNKLEEFRSESISSSEVLLDNYRLIQQKRAKYESKVDRIWANIERGWHTEELCDDTLVLIPKSCTTTGPKRGAIVSKSHNRGDMSFKFEGTLVDVPQRDLELAPIDDRAISVSHFDLAGKSGGIGSVNVKNILTKNEDSFQVRIIPKTREIAQSSLIFGTPIAGISVAILWWLGIPLGSAGSVALLAGGIGGILLFVVQYLRLKLNISIVLTEPIIRVVNHISSWIK